MSATAKPPTQRRRRMPRAEREQQMIEVAESVFAERGYSAASMDEIAERVGVSKPMLYEYFQSKEGLLLACIQAARSALRDATQRAVLDATTAEEALRKGLLAFFEFVRDRRQAWSLLRHETSLVGTSAADELEATRKQQTDLIASLMGGYLNVSDPALTHAMAEFVVGGCERLALWCEQNENITPETATDYTMNLLWGGLRHLAQQ
ncbi:TetR/AcrR family transcriptional regulator [Saccharomonospora cyanea]|uniref:Transcriptional regulator n=1 Tax=Saccharomonospora cyanea NA-134 TaxID=882082 RepID=H5XGW9_9PSEU|nr:TetR/AcrR family transcriptional regulator [Saccharomonospora cyanea]EHR62696.1 transcriptional regulator [Saccharomonospora cyanea NA-134]